MNEVAISNAQEVKELLARPNVPFTRCVQLLAEKRSIPEFEALKLIGAQLGLQVLALEELNLLQPDLDAASFADCQRRNILLAIDKDDTEHYFLVTSRPLDTQSHQWFEAIVEKQAPRNLIRAVVLEEDFQTFLSSVEQGLRAMDSLHHSDNLEDLVDTTDEPVLVLSIASIEATKNPTVRLVDSTLYDALKQGASDIHFEVQQKVLYIKYRLDGVLQAITHIDSQEASNQVISRIKVLSDLDISERRIPQDGRFRVMLDQREIDFRVSIMPNISGEDAVLRILDRKHLTGQFETLSLDSLSFEQEIKDFIRQSSRLPYGLLLVTGPTGSGKTTTLYAAISEINTGLDKIITIEDPIEYQLNGVLQIPVNEKKGLTFAKGLRSVLRHDPDKIMVGEIRDSETAQIAVQAALTGHQVFTTVHANNVFDVIGRFSNMGVDSYSLVAALTGIMAQRLVRAVCRHCCEDVEPQKSDLRLFETLPQYHSRNTPSFKRARGCAHCRGTGYKGRTAIAEILPIDDAMKDLLVSHAPISRIKSEAREKGFLSLRDSALALVMRGVTTMDEINRVTPVQ